MKTSDFNYELPKELIAQDPLADRSSSRLLLLDKKTGELSHKHFSDIIILSPETASYSTIQRLFPQGF